MINNVKIEYNKESGETELTLKYGYNLNKLYDMCDKDLKCWQDNLSKDERNKFYLFVSTLNNNGYETTLINNDFYRITPKCMPFELDDYKAIKGEKIKPNYKSYMDMLHCYFLILDINKDTKKVIIYDSEDLVLRTYTVSEMYELFTRLDGTKFEKGVI